MRPEATGEWSGARWLVDPAALAIWRSASESLPFVHPTWLTTWWSAHGVDETEVRVWSACTTDGVGTYAAWLLQSRRWPGGLTVRRLQPLGQGGWIADAFPGEYTALAGREEPAVAEWALEATLALDWDELLLERVPASGALADAIARWSARHALPAESVAHSPAWRVATVGAPERHRAALRPGERRALYARSARAEVEYVPDAGELDTLYRLHDRRWAGAGMPARVRRFVDALVCARTPDYRLRVSLLLHRGNACSARLLLDCRGTTYDLQSGFDPAAVPGVSPGKLHLGYEIERAFADPTTRRLDLLAGRGMRTDYKARLAAEPVPLHDVRITRSQWVRALRGARRLVGSSRLRLRRADPAPAGATPARPPRSPVPRAPRGDGDR